MYYWNLNQEEVLSKICVKLKHLRVTADLSQESLAEKSGLSRNAISEMERGINFTISSLLSYLRTLNKLDYLEQFFTENKTPISPIKLYELEKKNQKKRGGYNK